MLVVTPTISANASPATVVKVEPHSSVVSVGESFTINITVTDVQNLFGVQVTLYWDPSILQVSKVNVRLGVESHPDGILHEIPQTAPIYFYKNEIAQVEGNYTLAASSTAPASSFNGSGNIVRITFNVINVGSCSLNLETKLASKPRPGEGSLPIEHSKIDGFFGQEAQQPTTWSYTPIIIAVIIVAVATTIVVFFQKRKKWKNSRPK